MGFFDFLKKNSTTNQPDSSLSFPQEGDKPILQKAEEAPELEVKPEIPASEPEVEPEVPVVAPEKEEVNKQLEEPLEIQKGVESFSVKEEPAKTSLGESIEFEDGEDMTETDDAPAEMDSADSDTSVDTDSGFDAE